MTHEMPGDAGSPVLERAPTGIAGFDIVSQGGIPRGRTTMVVGGPGSGKSIFGLQTLVNGAREFGESGIFVAMEEPVDQILANAAGFHWNLQELIADRGEDRGPWIHFFNARITSNIIAGGRFDLEGTLALLLARVRQMGATRIVFDGLDVLLSMLNTSSAKRGEAFRIHDWMVEHGLTGIITAKSEVSDPYQIPYPSLQFMVDCLVHFTHELKELASERDLRIAKYRGSNASTNKFPFAIGERGIQVLDFGTLARESRPLNERVSTGLDRLDEMVGGGYFRGSTTLVTGSSGTGKTTLASCFASAACARGDLTLFVSFDEDDPELVRNMSTMGIRLDEHLESGMLTMHSATLESDSAARHMIRIQELIRRQKCRCLVVDPVSALLKSGTEYAATSVVRYLVNLARSEGITSVFTCMVDRAEMAQGSTELNVSTTCDTWLHLSLELQYGERNRSMSIVKSRGTHHSSQIREFVLTPEGPAIRDAYTMEGEVVMGTMRRHREIVEGLERRRLRRQLVKDRLELEAEQRRLRARMEGLQLELRLSEEELKILRDEQQEREEYWRRQEEGAVRPRGGPTFSDGDSPGGGS
ncbi:MAG: circadian clock protein KaiC [Desulfatibacillaceae bacterium]